MKKTKPEKYTKPEKVIIDWADKKNYLFLYKMLEFYVRLGMIVD